MVHDVHETEGERARRVGEIVDPPHAELDAMVGGSYCLVTTMRTWATDDPATPKADIFGKVPATVRRSTVFLVRARLGDRLLGIHDGLAYLLRPGWLMEAP